MKKLKNLSLLLAAAVLLTALPHSAYASAEADMKNVLEKIKSQIGSTDIYDTFESSTSEYDGCLTYSFHWSTSDTDARSYMSLEADADGIITQYNKYTNEAASSAKSLTSPSSAEVLPKANELLKRLNPEIAEKLVLSKADLYESFFEDGYSFSVQRYENGFPVIGDTGYIQLNSDADEIEYFYLNYTKNVNFEKPGSLITPTEAQNSYKAELPLKLSYKTEYDYSDETRKQYLAYTADDSLRYVSAESGSIFFQELRSSDNYRNDYGVAKEEAASDSAGGAGSSLSEAEAEELSRREDLLARDELLRLIYDNKFIGIDSSYQQSSYYRRHDTFEDRYTDTFRLTKETDNSYSTASVTLNSKTGAVLSFSLYDHDGSASGDTSAVISYTDAIGIAEDTAAALAGEAWSKYRLSEQSSPADKPVQYITYLRFENGIETEDTITMAVSAAKNAVTEYRINHTDTEFPSADGVLTPETAADKLFSYLTYEPVYVISAAADGGVISALVYSFTGDMPKTVDALSGKLLTGYSSKEYKASTPIAYTDLTDHYAKDRVELLAEYGIGFEGGALRPQDEILKKEFTALLVNASWRSSVILGDETDYDSIFRRVKRYGITSEDSDRPITRLEAARLMIKIMELEDTAGLDIYKPMFKDITENEGYTSILAGMGIFSGDGSGCFNPNVTLTRADALILIYNYLK